MTENPRGAKGWVFLAPEDVPPRWRWRAVPVSMVPLLPGETDELLGEGPAAPEIEPDDEPVARLAARGFPAARIASELGISLRSVYRKLARLRRRLNVESAAELADELSRRGFGA